MDIRDKAALVREYFAVVDARQFDRLEELFDSGYILHFDSMPAMGPEAAASFFGEFLSAFPDLAHTVLDVIADGDRAAARITLTATHLGPFMGIPASGKTIAVPAIDLFRFTGNRIAEQWIVSDSLGMLRQLGALPAPEAQPV
jgi:steroid delta-isomerase-like uncharacterized protein